MNEADLANLGFVKQPDGSWSARSLVDTGLPAAKPQPGVVPSLAGSPQDEARGTDRVRVTITTYRRRLLDPDNAVCKWTIDCLRREGYLRDDTANDIALDLRQVKVQTKAEEGTLIELRPL